MEVAGAVGQHDGYGIGRCVRDRAPAGFGALERDERSLRRSVPVVLHGMVVAVRAVGVAVPAVESPLQFRNDQRRAVRYDSQRLYDKRITGGAQAF